MRAKLASFFGKMAFLAFAILAACIAFLPYVGVKITYVCLPVGVISGLLWYWFSEKEE
ncbi:MULTISPECIES: hypothetical protein [Avibacterium]|uniref:Uncharacterized protein n=1 Tax=Avibacterium paragallinarum TaxID=728 RepID=A0A377I7D3_AVIPA|nr:hypothetical protein [Avibacterium paragallinarum]CDF98846.1 Hypothetical protein AJF4211_000310 [Avibacterium paragallinarum JF4211]CDF99393.1 Hypothetical protein AJF4211_001090 [Avibacterium paragallinarum JF4211]STO71225.1 Uncharacterised protein [Avibacterium paragallinarum]STO72104.1 Uncharacterised protein [Avibacterium paragallinarum]SUU96972.1 Uncharacterised protein [Avibacterium paragallinarum]